MATINTLAVFFLLLNSLVSGEALFAEGIGQSLNPRDATDGGWALAAPSCPAGTTSCTSSDNASTCCPNEFECKYDWTTRQHFCCTAGANCQTTIQNIPVCANTSWNLYDEGFLSGYFCCLPGQLGILGSSAYTYGSCGDAGRAYPTSQLATSVAEPTGLASAKSSSSSSLASGTANAQPSPANIQSNTANAQSNTANAQSSPASATQSSSTTPTPSPSPKASSSSTKLGTGTIVGIAVGGVVLIAIMGIIGCMCFRHGQRRSPKEAEATANPTYDASLTPLGAEKSKELSATSPPTSRSELEYRPQRAELAGAGGYGN